MKNPLPKQPRLLCEVMACCVLPKERHPICPDLTVFCKVLVGNGFTFTHQDHTFNWFAVLFKLTVCLPHFSLRLLFYREEKWEINAFRQNICQKLSQSWIMYLGHRNKSKYSDIQFSSVRTVKLQYVLFYLIVCSSGMNHPSVYLYPVAST